MGRNQGPDPNRERLVFWSSTVNAIEQLLVLVLNRLSSDVPLGGRAGESFALDDNDVCSGGDAFVGVTAGVELLHPFNNLLLELLSAHGALFRSLHK